MLRANVHSLSNAGALKQKSNSCRASNPSLLQPRTCSPVSVHHKHTSLVPRRAGCSRRGSLQFSSRSVKRQIRAESGAPSESDESSEAGGSESVAATLGGPEDTTGGSGRLVAIGSSVAGVALFAVTRLLGSGVGLEDLAANAMPLDEALRNSSPTVIEFYADWCEVCRELAPTIYKVENNYKDKVNFVMLNIDNSKWADEVSQYSVDGIPQFVFLDSKGAEKATVVGNLPQEVLQGNVEALALQAPDLPFTKARAAASSISDAPPQTFSTDPRAHS